MENLKQKLISPIAMWLIVAGGIIVLVKFLPARTLFRPNVFTYALFAISIVNWLYFLIRGIKVNRSAARSAAAVDRIVTCDVYAMVRHPIYSADIILAWGVFLFSPTLKILCSAAWLTIVMISWMKLEEAALAERFGEEYEQYKSHTPMMIPNYLGRRGGSDNLPPRMPY